mgnify:CR=1 FL=1
MHKHPVMSSQPLYPTKQRLLKIRVPQEPAGALHRSFMESELLRMGKGEYDLSEMFIVRQKYMNQMEDNYLRRGKGSIGEGSLAHTFKNAYKKAGIVPEEVYTGLLGDTKTTITEHCHATSKHW